MEHRCDNCGRHRADVRQVQTLGPDDDARDPYTIEYLCKECRDIEETFGIRHIDVTSA